MAERLLVVEDHADLRDFCVQTLTDAGFDTVAVGSGVEAEHVLRTSPVALVVADLRMPRVGGLDVLKRAKETDPTTAVILITGFPAVETAVAAMKAGAADYLAKPFSADQLLDAVREGLGARKQRKIYEALRAEVHAFTVEGMVGRSARMLQLLDTIRRAAAVDANVLILGDSGTGKELVARTIHANSARRRGPFLAVNCAALPESLLEAELFGHERGAFTGAHNTRDGLLHAADGGTVLLDELCEMHPAIQAKLLRALEEGSVRRLGGRKAIAFDVRFIAATNQDIEAAVRAGRFRRDLFFRIHVIEIHVPPLAQRRDDIPLLAVHFLQQASAARSTGIEGIDQAALESLTTYDWPGNVRELRNVIERAAAFASSSIITVDDLPAAITVHAARHMPATFRAWKKQTLEQLAHGFIQRALDDHGGNISRTAHALGLHRSTIQRRLKRVPTSRGNLADDP
jgi:DNA-binding NtrC family response regulator